MNLKMLAVAALVLLPVSGHADQASASACAGNLSKDGRMLYDKAAPSVTPSSDIREVLRSVARPLVMNGTLSRDAALAAAEPAGECLKLLK